jgi:glycosyltransferase involved in cell wall biosynthesis
VPTCQDSGVVLASSWYAEMLGGGLTNADEALRNGLPAPLRAAAAHIAPLRGLALHRLAGREGALVLTAGERGATTALVLAALRRRRRLVLLELIAPPPSPAPWRRRARELWRRAVVRPAARRAVLAAHVLTDAERAECARIFGIPVERIQHVPWAWCRDPDEPAPSSDRAGVVVSGRASCDWPTVFAAARGREWPLTVVCGERDLPVVGALNREGAVRVRVEASREEHDRVVRGAAVYVVALRDELGSAGQVRLMTATQARTPVVASDVPALEGYVVGGETAVVVPPGDPAALRRAVEGLLADPDRASRLAAQAFERATGWTYPMYFDAIRELIERALATGRADGPPAGP